MIDQATEANGYVSSDKKLAEIYGHHRASFPRWRRQYADAPRPRDNGDHSVKAWAEWFAKHPSIRKQSALPPNPWKKLAFARSALAGLAAVACQDYRRHCKHQPHALQQALELDAARRAYLRALWTYVRIISSDL